MLSPCPRSALASCRRAPAPIRPDWAAASTGALPPPRGSPRRGSDSPPSASRLSSDLRCRGGPRPSFS
eukprot:4565466-Pyramimonas_sp.AAC.1